MIRHLLQERALGQDGSGALEASLPLVAVPEGVRQVIARRYARLPDNAERIAESASGFAGPFLFPVAAAAASIDDQAALAALDELLAAGLIRPAEAAERYEFVHALVRQAIYDTLSPSRQARLHRRLAQALETARQRVPGCAEPAEIVAQYARSQALPGASAGVAAALEAADLAQATGAHETAVAFLATAADLADLTTSGSPRSVPGSGWPWPGRCDSTRPPRRPATPRNGLPKLTAPTPPRPISPGSPPR